LIITGCLIAVAAIAGCGSGSSSDPGSTSGSTSSPDSKSASAESGKSGKADGSSESGEIPASAKPLTKPPAKVEIPTGLPKGKLATKDIKEGAGEAAEPGDEVTVQYVGVGVKSEEKFDSSWERAEPLSFELGGGKVIKGWDEGLKGMKVGGRRELYVPAKLAYGSKGTSSIAPNEDLVFVVDLLSVKPGT
jgi:peptidylprolyl isomerase